MFIATLVHLSNFQSCKYCSDIVSADDCMPCKNFGTVTALKNNTVNKEKQTKK